MAEGERGVIPFRTALNEPPKPWIEILVPRPGEPVVGVMVTQTWVAVPTHYSYPRTHAHTEPASECPYCQQHIPIRQRCFVGSYQFSQGRYVIQQFSPASLTATKPLLQKQGQLRGWQLTTIRAGKSQQSRIFCRVEYYRECDLPPAFDLCEQLTRIYQGGKAHGEV